MNHKQVADDILSAIGGLENVSSLTHCVTRLRFKLKDGEKANREVVKNIKGVMSLIEQGGQFQVVIGKEVEGVYNEVCKLLNNSISEEVDDNKNEKLFDKFSSMISGIFTPMLGVLGATGMLKGLLAVLVVSGLLMEDSFTYQVMYSISNTVFYFMPVLLGATAAKFFKIDIFIGMVIGAAMVYPDIIGLSSSEGTNLFLGIPMNLIDYTSSVFPVIAAVWVASLLNKAIEKYIPKTLKFLLLPLIILTVTIPLTFFVVGPVLTSVSEFISTITFAIYNFNPIIGGVVLGGPWILIVMFGLHWTFIPIFVSNLAAYGSDATLALLTANQFAMAGALIAIALKSKDKDERGLSWSTGSMCLLGVSEPGLYGLLLPLKKPLVMSVIGGSIGGAIAGVFNSKLYSFGGSGLLQIPLAINPQGIDSGFYGLCLSALVGFLATFILTYLIGYKTSSSDINQLEKAK